MVDAALMSSQVVGLSPEGRAASNAPRRCRRDSAGLHAGREGRVVMLRTKLALLAMAARAGWALGAMFPPATCRVVGRRIAWRTDRQWRAAARASRRPIERAAARAWKELEDRKTRIVETIAARVS